MTVVRPLPPNSTIVRFPNRRPFPNTNGRPYDNPRGPYSNHTGSHNTSVTPYVPPYITPSPTIQAEGRHFPLNPNSSTPANNRIKSEDRDLDDDINGRGTSANTVNFVPEIRMVDREDFLSEVKLTHIETTCADNKTNMRTHILESPGSRVHWRRVFPC